jgi:hypothetical protein
MLLLIFLLPGLLLGFLANPLFFLLLFGLFLIPIVFVR